MEHPEQHEDAPPVANRAVKLPPFWTANPRAWFTSAEGAFRLCNIADEESRFFNCLHALPPCPCKYEVVSKYVKRILEGTEKLLKNKNV
jgi:hypothetical protein